MVFTNQDFIDLMEFCRDLNNFHKKAKKTFDTVYNISKSDGNHKHPLIPDSRYWCYNLDEICINAHIKNNGRKITHPASTDGLHYTLDNSDFNLYFMEFKGLPINSIDYKSKLDSINRSLKLGHCEEPRDNCPISEEIFRSLTNAKNRFEDEIICQLKIKTTEYYCKKNNIDYNEHLDEFISWLLKSKKNFIVVFDNKVNLSPTNKHFSFENRLRDKFNKFSNVANITPSVVEKDVFEKKYLYKYFDRIDLPAYTTVDYVGFLGEYAS